MSEATQASEVSGGNRSFFDVVSNIETTNNVPEKYGEFSNQVNINANETFSFDLTFDTTLFTSLSATYDVYDQMLSEILKSKLAVLSYVRLPFTVLNAPQNIDVLVKHNSSSATISVSFDQDPTAF